MSRWIDGNLYQTYEVHCGQCGLIAGCPEPDVTTRITQHIVTSHGTSNTHAAHAWIENRDWHRKEAVYRCDACNHPIEAPFWMHVVTGRRTAGLSLDSDPTWMICQTCHDLIAARDIEALSLRNHEQQMRDYPVVVGGHPELAPMVIDRLNEHFAELVDVLNAGVRHDQDLLDYLLKED